MALLDPIRSNAISRGVLGSSRFWLVVGGLAWLVRAWSWARRPHESTMFRQVIEPGQTVAQARAEASRLASRSWRVSRAIRSIASTLAADEPWGSNSEESQLSVIALASSGPMTRASMAMI